MCLRHPPARVLFSGTVVPFPFNKTDSDRCSERHALKGPHRSNLDRTFTDEESMPALTDEIKAFHLRSKAFIVIGLVRFDTPSEVGGVKVNFDIELAASKSTLRPQPPLRPEDVQANQAASCPGRGIR